MRHSLNISMFYRLGITLGGALCLLSLLLAWPAPPHPVQAEDASPPPLPSLDLSKPASRPLPQPQTDLPPSCQYIPEPIQDTSADVTNSQPSIDNSGNYIAYVSEKNGQSRIRLYYNNILSGTVSDVEVTSEDSSIQPAISGESERLVFVSDGNFDSSPDNPDGNFEIFLTDVTGGTPTSINQLTDSEGALIPGLTAFPSVDNSGNPIAFVSDHNLTGSNPDNNPEIFEWSPVRQVTISSGATNGAPSINSNGSRIAFISDADLEENGNNSDHSQELFLYDSQATPEISQLTFTGNEVTHQQPSISGDGTRIAFVSDEDGNPEIFLYDEGDDDIRPVTTTSDGVTNSRPVLSRDGQRLAYVSDKDGNQEIFVALLKDWPAVPTITQVTNTPIGVINTEPAINEDGGVIAFASTFASPTTPISNTGGNQEIFRAECKFADLEISKSGDKFASRGESFVYTFVISNVGQVDFENITLSDTIPASFVINSDSIMGCDNNPMEDPPVIDGQTLNCQIDSLPAGAPPHPVTLSVTTPNDPGRFPNTASVTGTAVLEGLEDTNPDNNSDDHVVYIDAADLEISKTSSVTEVVVGDELIYTITVTNSGPTPVENVNIIDTLPSGILLLKPETDGRLINDKFDGTVISPTLWTTKQIISTSHVVVQNGSAAFTDAGHLITKEQFDPEQAKITIVGEWKFEVNDELYVLTRSDGVAATDGQTLNGLEFYVKAGKETKQEDAIAIRRRENGTLSVLDEVSDDFWGIPTKNSDKLENNDVISFTITDDGNMVTFDVEKIAPDTEEFPPLSFPVDTASTSNAENYIVFHSRFFGNDNRKTSFLNEVRIETPSSSGCRRTGDIVTCNEGNLAVGKNIIRKFEIAVVEFSQEATLSNKVRIDDEAIPQPDPDLENNWDKAEVTLKAVGLALTKEVTPTTLFSGDPLTYTLTVFNNDDAPFTNVVLTDTFPASLASPVIDSSQGTCTPPTNGQIICQVGTLASGGRATVTIKAISTVTDLLVNTAVVTGTGNDKNNADNTDNAEAFVNAVDLALTKVAQTASSDIDEPLVYILQVTNNGPLAATNVTLTDPLTAGLAYVSAVPAQGSCNQAANGFTCALGGIPIGGMVPVTVTVKPTVLGDVTNKAQVTGAEPDPVPNNNNDSDTVNIFGPIQVYLPLIYKN